MTTFFTWTHLQWKSRWSSGLFCWWSCRESNPGPEKMNVYVLHA